MFRAEVLAPTGPVAEFATTGLPVAALEKLIEAAKTENRPDVVYFAEKLMLHAQAEEQVSYPTSLLIGHYVKSKLAAT